MRYFTISSHEDESRKTVNQFRDLYRGLDCYSPSRLLLGLSTLPRLRSLSLYLPARITITCHDLTAVAAKGKLGHLTISSTKDGYSGSHGHNSLTSTSYPTVYKQHILTHSIMSSRISHPAIWAYRLGCRRASLLLIALESRLPGRSSRRDLSTLYLESQPEGLCADSHQLDSACAQRLPR